MLIDAFQLRLFQQMEPHFSSSVERGIKDLLENKHLYQNIKVEPPDKNVIDQEIRRYLSGSIPGSANKVSEVCNSLYSLFPDIKWEIEDPVERRRLPIKSDSEINLVTLKFYPPTVKLYCSICKRTEAYNFQYGEDLLSEFRGAEELTKPVNIQIFSLAYQCQSCKSIPEFFMVRRDNHKLVQSGRTPIEEIVIPPYLPKEQRSFFSDALLAFYSGQILAGNFLLRTFIEQLVRQNSPTPDTQNIDTLFSEYGKGLPHDFKQRFVSLQSIYDNLSEDLHFAKASEELFLQARSNIERHFQAKELFKI
jgi:hypothetical protein